MHKLSDIKHYYEKNLWGFAENILREYLQYKILEIIFDLSIGEKLSFLGGTAIRIIYNSERFSLDLDFDNFSLTETEFTEIGENLKKSLELEGCNIKVDLNLKRGVFHYNIKFNNILYENGLSQHKNQKLLIKLDSQAHNFPYKSELKLLKRFNIQSYIRVTPVDVLLSQKICALLGRKRKLGRDFYDIAYLSSFTKPSYDYLLEKVLIKTPDELKERLIHECSKTNFDELVKDTKPLVFNSKGLKFVTLFPDFVKEHKF